MFGATMVWRDSVAYVVRVKYYGQQYNDIIRLMVAGGGGIGNNSMAASVD